VLRETSHGRDCFYQLPPPPATGVVTATLPLTWTLALLAAARTACDRGNRRSRISAS